MSLANNASPILSTSRWSSIRAFYPKAWHHLLTLAPAPDQCSVAEYAHDHGLDLNALLFRLNQQEGTLPQFLPTLPLAERVRLTKPGQTSPEEGARLQQVWQSIPVDKRRQVDARASLQQGVDPFAEIQRALQGLPTDGALLLLIPFQPLPLYEVLPHLGYQHLAAFQEDIWHIVIQHQASQPVAQGAAVTGAVLDVRDLPSPEPLVRILESTALLQAGQSLHVIHNRLPHLLFPRLAERQLTVVTEEAPDGTIHLMITKPAGS